jgi:hypothetical protein
LADKNNEDREGLDYEKKFAKKVFVVLRTPALAYNIISIESNSYFKTYAPDCLIRKFDRWYWERAPEPTDINFENLNFLTSQRVCKTLISYIIMLPCLFMSGIIIYYISEYLEE